MIAILMIMACAAGVAIGIGLTLTGKWAAIKYGSGTAELKKELVYTKQNLALAAKTLRSIASGMSGNPQLEADVTLDEIDLKEIDRLNGR